MSCLHPYSDFYVQLHSRWIVSCLVFFLLATWDAECQNVNLVFPVFNSSTFTCSGIPVVLGYSSCFFNSSGEVVNVLPPGYNNVYPNQAARMMYNTDVMFENSGASIKASFSTFFIFSVSHVPSQTVVGAGFAFLIAPEVTTPANSAGGGFGLYAMNTSTGVPLGVEPMVFAVEFDTSNTIGIDTVAVPHIGIDLSSLGGSEGNNNATQIGTEFLDTTLGMWIEYNYSLHTIKVYCIPVTATDGSAASLKPATPIVTLNDTWMSLNRRSYIGFGAGVFDGGFENNLLYYWSFQTFGFPPETLLAQWYQWWAPLSTTKKIGLIAGAVVGTIGGAYLCSECLFFCFFKRIKNPQTPAEQRWPVQRRTSLPGTKTKKPPPRKKVRDSLSVANPLHLWGAPLEPAEDPDGESQNSPTSDLGAISEVDDSSNEDTPLMSPPDIEKDEQNVSEFEAIEARVDQSSKSASKHREKSRDAARKPAPAQKAVPPPKEERRPSLPAKSKSETQVAKTQSHAAPIQRKPSQVGTKGPAQGVQAVKSGSPPQQKPPQALPGEKKVASPGVKPSSPPQQRPSQVSAGKKVAAQGARPTSPLKKGPSQGGKNATPQKIAPQLATKTPSPQKVAPQPATQTPSPQKVAPQPAAKTPSPRKPSPTAARTTVPAPQKSPPKGRRPSQVPKKEPPKAPRPSQLSPPKATPRPSPQTSPKAVPRPQPKSPPKK